MNKELLQQAEERLGYQFRNPALLEEALIHSSWANSRLASNERLEFLGDAVLGLLICQCLYERFPDYLEGDLTKLKSVLVSRKICAQIARTLGLLDFIQVGKGTNGSRALNGSIAAGTLEAVLAAIYLDGGFSAAEHFVRKHFGPYLETADAQGHLENFKSILQQYSQRHLNATPSYRLLDEKGPDHNKCFEVCAVVGQRMFSSAWGATKKEAEQRAALKALIELGVLQDEGNRPAEPPAT
ncbi:MAG: ribonuclease III [Anaerohalosphaeraceae bacterium]